MNFENIDFVIGEFGLFLAFTVYACGDYKSVEVVPSRCHGSKISGWQQIKTSLKKWIRTVSNFIDLI